ncbi:MAG TPA: class I SAM-dependent methyltransferase [Gemmatimonadaceae bacterium]|nr:class I SAM-dependent methyltransferase [Gemmatimonadaceae bacterium]
MWNERYAAPDFVYGTEPNDFLRSVANRIPPGPVLCLAEGQGRNAVYLASLGHDVVAVDQSTVGLQRAQELAAARGVTITTEVADLAEYRITPGTWAGIVAIFMHLPPALRAQVLAASVQGLAPGGAFIMEAYRPKQLEYGTGGPGDVSLLVSLDDLRRELAGLRIEHGVETEREIHEGAYHKGHSAVVQMLAFKAAAG